MKLHRLILIFIVFSLFLLPFSGNVSANTNWETIKNEHFIIFFKQGHEEEAKQVLKILEYYRPQVEKLSDNKAYHLPIVIDDVGTNANGFASPILKQIHLNQYSFTQGVENWWALVGVHEYTHHLTLSKSTGWPGFLNKIFGNDIFYMPNMTIPGWIQEGITVYSESQLSPYQGRLNDGLYDAYIATAASEGRLASILDATYFPLAYQMDGIYTYGGEFLNYLSQTYGEDKFAWFFAENGGSFAYLSQLPNLGIDSAATKVYHKSFPELWDEWVKYETEKYKDYKVDGERVTHNGWNVSSPLIANGKIYYQKSYPSKTGANEGFNFNEIIARDLGSGAERMLVSTTAGFSAPLKIKNGKLYYACYELKPGFHNSSQLSYGLYSVVHEYDLNSGGKDRVLLQEGLRSFDIFANGSIVYTKDRDKEYGSEIYLFDPDTFEKKLIFQTDYLVDDIANDGERIVVSAKKDWENLSLYSLNLETHEFTPLVHTPYVESNPVLGGDKLFFTANYEEFPGAFCYDFSDNQVYRLTKNGAALNPVYDSANGQVYFLSLDAGGYDLYRKSLELNVFEMPESQPSAIPALDTIPESGFTKGNYFDNLKTLAPKMWSPVLAVTPGDNSEYGLGFTGGDAVGDFPSYFVSLTYNTKAKKLNYYLDLTSEYFAPLRISLTISDRNQIMQPLVPEDMVNRDQNYVRLDLEYPLITKLSPGLSNLSIGTSVNLQPNLPGPEFNPYLVAGLQYPKTNTTLTAGSFIGKSEFGDNYTAFYGDLKANQYLSHSQLSLEISGAKVWNGNVTIPPIRGYEYNIKTSQGGIMSLEYSQPLLKIRKGLWNPNIYFEDLTGNIFLDRTIAEGKDMESSWGAELHLETKMMYMATIDWGLRYVQNIDGEGNCEVFIDSIN